MRKIFLFPKLFLMSSRNKFHAFGISMLIAAFSAGAANSCRDVFVPAVTVNAGPTFALIALGHDSKLAPLGAFANQIQDRFRQTVVTYQKFAEAGYTDQIGKWWETLPPNKITSVVEEAIRKAVASHPGQKMILFNLDSYDPTELFNSSGEAIWSYTNFEVQLLLRDQNLFAATRWFKNGRELSLSESYLFWAQTLLMLHPETKFIKHRH